MDLLDKVTCAAALTSVVISAANGDFSEAAAWVIVVLMYLRLYTINSNKNS